jgi:hypothetical protein
MADGLAVPPLLATARGPAASQFADEAVTALRRPASGYGFMSTDKVAGAEAALALLGNGSGTGFGSASNALVPRQARHLIDFAGLAAAEGR